MRTPEEIWKSLLIPNNNTIAVITIPDIATIQKEAFECGQKDISDDIIKNGMCFDHLDLKRIKFVFGGMAHLDCCATDQCKVTSETKP